MRQFDVIALTLVMAGFGACCLADPGASSMVTPPIVGDSGATWTASPNFNARIPQGVPVDVIVLHSTCTSTNDTSETVRLFQDKASQVSSHYVVGKDGQIVQMVSETNRAWHAGVCRWQGRTDINSCSIGIEMVHRDQDPNDNWPPAQVEAVARLLFDIRSRHRISNDHVIFHSECAYPPGRKTDPQKFDRPYLLQRVMLLALEQTRQ
jgi:N-acetylmuramoyl-L-alanine amidase